MSFILARYRATPPTIVDGQPEELQLDNRGNLKVAAGLNPVTDVPVPFGRKTSNGTTKVAIVAAATGKTVYAATMCAYNAGSGAHTLTFYSVPSNTVLLEVYLTAGANALLDVVGGVQSVVSEGLSFAIDAAATSTDCIVTGNAVQK